MACRQCGWCCDHLTLVIADEFDADSLKWLGERGIEIHGHMLVIPSKCQHLRTRRGRAHCAIYDTRPKVCVVSACPRFPERPDTAATAHCLSGYSAPSRV